MDGVLRRHEVEVEADIDEGRNVESAKRHARCRLNQLILRDGDLTSSNLHPSATLCKIVHDADRDAFRDGKWGV